MKLLCVILCLLACSLSQILVIVDNLNLKNTHSQFFQMLGKIRKVEFANSFGRTKIELKSFDKFKYESIIVMCTSQKQIESQIKVSDIISYFDEGGNVVVISDIDISRSFRKLFNAFGVDLEESGTMLKDNFNYHISNQIISTTNYEEIAPFIHDDPQIKQPLLYRGIGMNLVNYINYQLYDLVRAQYTTYSRNIQLKTTSKTGSTISLIAAVQGLNNARALLSGSLDFFSNQFFQVQQYGNRKVVDDLINWTFKREGIIRVRDMHYHGQGGVSKQTLFNVGEKIYYQVNAEIFNYKTNTWQPYITNDLQVQFVMLDPWVRANLVNLDGGSKYSASFYAPSKEGIYQFKVIYKKAGYTLITESERVTVRPYKHDQFERFIFVAYPYYLGLFFTVISTFMFLFAYLYSSFGKSKAQ